MYLKVPENKTEQEQGSMTFQIMIYVTAVTLHNVGTHSSSYRNPVMFVVGHPKNIKMHIPVNRKHNSSQCLYVSGNVPNKH